MRGRPGELPGAGDRQAQRSNRITVEIDALVGAGSVEKHGIPYLPTAGGDPNVLRELRPRGTR